MNSRSSSSVQLREVVRAWEKKGVSAHLRVVCGWVRTNLELALEEVVVDVEGAPFVVEVGL